MSTKILCHDTCFECRNQHLKGCRTASTRATSAMPLMFLLGVLFIPVGIGLLATSDKIKEKVFEYSENEKCRRCENGLEERMKRGLSRDCNCTIDVHLNTKWEGDVFFLYGLSNFYQNNLRYVRSRSYEQLYGELNNETVPKSCGEYGTNSVSAVYAPCGAIANSMFTDTFQLISINNGKVPMSHENVAWPSDRDTNYKNPRGDLKEAFKYFAKPKYWINRVEELDDDEKDDDGNGFLNNDLMVWMRVAAFPTFRKLYRTLARSGGNGKFMNGLPDGDYKLFIKYRYPVSGFNGKKIFVMTTSSWIGGKSTVFGVGYIVVGTVCLVFGFCFLLINMFDHRRKSTRAV